MTITCRNCGCEFAIPGKDGKCVCSPGHKLQCVKNEMHKLYGKRSREKEQRHES